jgi:transcriptional regulator with XRE-family HTH domain
MSSKGKILSSAATRPVRAVTHHLRAWRKKKGMIVTELAEGAQLTGSMISQLERGRTSYSQNSLEAIARALDVDTWELLASDGELKVCVGRGAFPNIDDQHRARLSAILSKIAEAIVGDYEQHHSHMLTSANDSH